MSDERDRDDDTDERSWLEKIAQIFSSDPHTRKDLLDILAVAEQNEVIDAETHQIMQGALDVAHQQVRDVMVPRPRMVCLDADAEPAEVLRQVIEAGHSRYPVIGESSDDVLPSRPGAQPKLQLAANAIRLIGFTQSEPAG